MRTFDLAPLYRSTVGFDRLFSICSISSADGGTPGLSALQYRADRRERLPHLRCGRRLLRARAIIEVKENTLTIRGEKQTKERREQRRGALPGHRRARLRARVPARRLRPGQGRRRWRTACCTSISSARSPRPRSRARSTIGNGQPARWSTPRLRKPPPAYDPLASRGSAPVAGALSFCAGPGASLVDGCGRGLGLRGVHGRGRGLRSRGGGRGRGFDIHRAPLIRRNRRGGRLRGGELRPRARQRGLRRRIR